MRLKYEMEEISKPAFRALNFIHIMNNLLGQRRSAVSPTLASSWEKSDTIIASFGVFEYLHNSTGSREPIPKATMKIPLFFIAVATVFGSGSFGSLIWVCLPSVISRVALVKKTKTCLCYVPNRSRLKSSHAQIFLKLATQKGNDLLLPERQKKLGVSDFVLERTCFEKYPKSEKSVFVS